MFELVLKNGSVNYSPKPVVSKDFMPMGNTRAEEVIYRPRTLCCTAVMKLWIVLLNETSSLVNCLYITPKLWLMW